ncbi:MAG: calcium/proton exchanger [Cyanobacteria bacterium CRU_2_1]|nr:calcium/proton exchanger [Cyanobacteria bacterium RU_5_0]NJR60581.1 calcium/proton exchanger [Cyanobacteria bacterium CRU_2_1]
MDFTKTVSLVLLIFVPISIAADVLHWGSFVVFLTSAISIIPLSLWLSISTEEIAADTSPLLGGLINAVFGNATELTIALVALRAGLVDIVKASITGTILSDLLLLMGLAMLAGGIRYKEQTFKPILTRVNGASMALAVIAIALPTMLISTSNVVDTETIRSLSSVTATILIIVYGLILVFSLKTHSHHYELDELEPNGITSDDKLEFKGTNTITIDGKVESIDNDSFKLWIWMVILLASTVTIAFESELFVGVVESETERMGLTPLFTGVILLPLISDAAGFVTVIRLALKNQMDLTVSVATGDSLLVALFVAPILVFIGQLMKQPIDLNFNPFEVVTLAIAVAVTNLISLSGRSNWLDGVLLLATYILLGVGFYYHPA